MKKRFLFLILIFLLGITLAGAVFAEEKKPEERQLEVLYPEIFGIAPAPGVGLPRYIEYIYKWAVALIGLIIFGVLIYNGIQYLLSVGSPEKMTEAKKGILAGFLGAIILLAAWLIFDTIDPQLRILEMPPLFPVPTVVLWGVYLCNFDVSRDVEGIIDRYTKVYGKIGMEEEQKKIVDEFYKKIRPRAGGAERCWRARTTDEPPITKIKSMFVVPEYDKAKPEPWEYNSAIIIKHKKWVRGWGGEECYLFPEPDTANRIFIKAPITYKTYKPKVITLIQKPTEPLPEDAEGVILYNTLAKGRVSPPPNKSPIRMPYEPKGVADIVADIKEVKTEDFKNAGFKDDIRSIEVNPEGRYVAVLQGWNRDQESSTILGVHLCAITNDTLYDRFDNNNVGRHPIGQCGARCRLIAPIEKASDRELEEYCKSCIDRITVIKAEIIW